MRLSQLEQITSYLERPSPTCGTLVFSRNFLREVDRHISRRAERILERNAAGVIPVWESILVIVFFD